MLQNTCTLSFNLATFASQNKNENEIMENLNYTSRYINRNFLLKVAGIDNKGNRINTLVGVTGMVALIGVDLFNKFIDRAINAGDDKCVCRLRRGIRVTLYSK